MRFVAQARSRLVIPAALLLAIFAAPSVASANAHGTVVAQHASAALVRIGDGYTRPEGSRRVRWIQRRLHLLGYATGPEDGRFGPLTERAVTRFQTEQHLAPDGIVGRITTAHLRAAHAVVRVGTGYAHPHGSRRVRAIQRRLRALGYAPGPIDGRFGPLTQRAVMRFQADRRLAPDGEVGPITSNRLLPHGLPSPSTRARTQAPTPTHPPTLPDLGTKARSHAPLHAPRPSLPHGPPTDVLLVAIAILGLAVFTGSYLRTRARLGERAR
jgi:peptidoglycan hydrolase-like protein with peptidoglycan-binding domain